MIDLFLKKNEYNQIALLGTVLSKNQNKITELEKQFNVSKRSFNRYITTLNEDLNTIYNGKLSLVYDGLNLQLSNSNNIEVHNIFMAVTKYYLNKSTSFKLLVLLSKNDTLNSEDILNQLHISYSYLNKLVKELNNHLEHSSITLVQRNCLLYMSGPAKNIIFFKSFLRLSLWRFEDSYTFKKENINDLMYFNPKYSNTLSQLQVIRLNHIEKALLEAKEKNNRITIYDNEIFELCQILTNHNNIVSSHNTDLTDDEHLFLNLVARIYCPQIDSLEDRLKLAQLFLEKQNSIPKDVMILLSSLEEKMNLTISQNKDDYYHFIYQGVMSFIYLRLFKYDFTFLFTFKMDFIKDLYVHNQPYYLKIKESLTYPFPFTNDKNALLLLRYPTPFYSLIYTAFRNKNKTVIEIFIDIKYQIGFEHFLKKRIETIFSSDAINYQQNIDLADIVITDSFIETREDQSAFILVEMNSVKEMETLIIKLTKIYTQKLLSTPDSY